MTFTSNWVKRRGFRMRLERPTLRTFQGEAVTGEARFESVSSRDIALRNIRVPLWAHIFSGLPEKVLEQPLTELDPLTPGKTRVHPFELKLPLHSALGWTGVGLTSGRGLLVGGTSIAVMINPERHIFLPYVNELHALPIPAQGTVSANALPLPANGAPVP